MSPGQLRVSERAPVTEPSVHQVEETADKAKYEKEGRGQNDSRRREGRPTAAARAARV